VGLLVTQYDVLLAAVILLLLSLHKVCLVPRDIYLSLLFGNIGTIVELAFVSKMALILSKRVVHGAQRRQVKPWARKTPSPTASAAERRLQAGGRHGAPGHPHHLQSSLSRGGLMDCRADFPVTHRQQRHQSQQRQATVTPHPKNTVATNE
ncbi:unnamed protein product, partial [Ectocarpus sp. 4 AP-2014]